MEKIELNWTEIEVVRNAVQWYINTRDQRPSFDFLERDNDANVELAKKLLLTKFVY